MIISTILGEKWLQKPKRGLYIRYFSDIVTNIRDIRNVRKVIKKKSFRRKKQVKKARCVTGTTTDTCSNQISIITPIAGPSSSLVDDDVADTSSSSLVVSHDDAYWRNRDLLIRRQCFSDFDDDDDVDVDLSDYDAAVFDNAVVDEDGDVIAIKSSSMNASTTNGDMVTIKSELLTEVLK